MSDNLEILKAIKEKERESEERIEKARTEASRIIHEATAESDKIVKEAEENARKMYEEYLSKEIERIEAEAEALKVQFKQQISRLNKEISQSVLDKMMEIMKE